VVVGKGIILGAVVALCAALASPAWADNQFTLAPKATSAGAVAVDAAGNAYVTWDNAQGMPMFCKVAPAAKRCADPIRLPPLTSAPLADNPSEATVPNLQNTVQPTPIVGPNGIVWVLANRYIVGDTLSWTSTNGGKSFASPREVPFDSTPPGNLRDTSDPWPDLLGVDDIVALDGSSLDGYVEGGNAGVDRSSGFPSIEYVESSAGSGALGFNLGGVNLALAGPPGVSEFRFSNTGGTVYGSTLGVSSYGSTAPKTPSDLVEAYWIGANPNQLRYYDFRYGPSHLVPPSPQRVWDGPVSLGDGDLPRIAGGPAGLFLLSQDGPSLNRIQIRRWKLSTHAFGTALTVARIANDGIGGGVGESLGDGELAAVWPQEDIGQLNLYLSHDGGATFTLALEIAAGDEFDGGDNARVAVAGNGTGWVTFRDSKGLELSNLYGDSLAFSKARLSKQHGVQYASVPVTCPAASGRCTVKLSLAASDHTQLGAQSFQPTAGAHSLLVKLSSAGVALLHAHHGKLAATLTVTLRPPGAPAHTTTARLTLT
jgi:hypothetical protein